jgi:EmrB/QacA subfamily drug resistance transporter
VLAITTAAAFVVFLDTTVVTIAFPSLQRAFPQATRTDLSWVLNGYNVVFAALLVPAGRVADAIGMRRAFVIGLSAFTVASVVCSAASSPAMLIVVRLVQACAGALLTPASRALLLAEYPPERRAGAIAVWAAGGGVAASLGPTIGALLVRAGDWRLVFLVNVPLAVAVGLAARGLLVERRRPEVALPDPVGTVMLVAAVACVALAIEQGASWGWSSPAVIAAFAGFAALLPLTAWRATRHPSPVIAVSLLRVRSFAVGNGATLLYSAGLFSLLLANVLFLTSVWRYSALSAGLALMPSAALTALVAVPASKLIGRHGPRAVIGTGALIFALGITWYAHRVSATPHFVSQWLPGAVLSGIGSGLAFPGLAGASVMSLPPTALGVGSAFNSMVRQIGAVLGIAVLVAIVGTPSPAHALHAFRAGWSFIAAAGLAAGVLIAWQWRRPSVARRHGLQPAGSSFPPNTSTTNPDGRSL